MKKQKPSRAKIEPPRTALASSAAVGAMLPLSHGFSATSRRDETALDY
jgi:hypothetical protein